ncbi:hypothetical protein NON00_13110 [Roseomonas sp. GC11]|uniref:hypothetical protein n=1 Tax=Roseomonas sp. GC11 TaxID=2950546 RepID=UPI00210E759C|nr:hypothetical protein [Roseomonas sp. GC11]MCQ4160867.1 hypothetical protein [Roseomonas sp. GC11]
MSILSDRDWTYAAPVGLGILGAAARLAMLQRQLTLGDVIRGIVMGAFAGLLVNAALSSVGVSDGVRSALIGAASFLADLILTGLLALGRRFAADPLGTFDEILSRVRRPAAAKDTAPPAPPAA